MTFNPIYPFELKNLPPQKPIKNSDFYDILLKARIELAELKGCCGELPNPLLLVSPLLIRESVESSGIENINTTVANVLENQILPEAEQKTEDKEVLRYKEALFWGFNNLNDLSISNRLILGIQKKLLPKSHHDYRKIQNGIKNTLTGELVYTPPVASDVSNLIGNLENYINKNKDVDPLITTAISHYQFEAIHPFGDGNGRTGRIIMVLQLVRNEVIDLPVLFISGYINKNKSEYYRLLEEVTSKGNWHEFINFMLQGFYLQAKETKDTIKKVTAQRKEIKNKIKTELPKIYSGDLIEALFTYPVISPTLLGKNLNMHYTTTSKYLAQLEGIGILKSMRVGRNHLYFNNKLINLLSK